MNERAPQEIELKLDVDPQDLPRLRRNPLLRGEGESGDRLVSHYFDTPDHQLRRAGYTLRVRRTKAGNVQTIKREAPNAAGLFVRAEWERPIAGKIPSIADSPLVGLVDPAALTLAFTTEIKRAVRHIVLGDARIEVSLDNGHIKAGTATEPLCEIELELKGGAAAPLFALAREIGALVPLRLGVRSKSERGYALIGGETRRSYRAEPILLDPDSDARDGFALIAGACIRQFRLNEPLLIATGAPEAVHQARVALRRLRSAFSSFKSLFEADPAGRALQDELRWLAGVLGMVRNLDVLIPTLKGADHERLTLERAEALAAAEAALESARARTLMIDLAEWLATGAWRTQPGAFASIVDVAETILAHHRKRIRRTGEHLAKLSDHKRHRVRIEAKKLRYASEFFASLWAGKKASRRYRTFVEVLEDLQDELGELNDLVTAGEVMAHYGLAPPKPRTKARGVLLRKAEQRLDHLLEAPRFWR